MTSEQATENSPVEPKLSAIKKKNMIDGVDPTGPSPLMPSLSPHPLARRAPGVEEPPVHTERRTAAKKMLVFDGQGANQVRGLKLLEEEDHRLGEFHKSEPASLPSMSTSHPHNGDESFSPQEVKSSHEVKPQKREECFSPQEVESPHEAKPNSTASTTQVIHTSDLQKDNLCHHDTTAASSSRIKNTAKGISTRPQRNILKRPNSASPAGSERKRLRRTMGVSDNETSTNASQESKDTQDYPEKTLEESYHQHDHQETVWSSPFFSGQPAVDDLNLYPDYDAEDPDSFLRRHGVDLFDNPSDRQDLIEFCEKSLTSTHSS